MPDLSDRLAPTLVSAIILVFIASLLWAIIEHWVGKLAAWLGTSAVVALLGLAIAETFRGQWQVALMWCLFVVLMGLWPATAGIPDRA
jgi:phosphotransferase system  glucose/maltose/N-acetylglucosamine-specific IIC component